MTECICHHLVGYGHSGVVVLKNVTICISLNIIWKYPWGRMKTNPHNSMWFTYAQISLERLVLKVLFEISSNTYICLNTCTSDFKITSNMYSDKSNLVECNYISIKCVELTSGVQWKYIQMTHWYFGSINTLWRYSVWNSLDLQIHYFPIYIPKIPKVCALPGPLFTGCLELAPCYHRIIGEYFAFTQGKQWKYIHMTQRGSRFRGKVLLKVHFEYSFNTAIGRAHSAPTCKFHRIYISSISALL